MRFRRPSVAQVFVGWCIAVILLLTIVVVPAVAGFDVPRATPQGIGATVEGRVTQVLERSTTSSPRGEIEHERLAVEVSGKTVTVTRDRSPDDIGALHVEAGDRVLLTTVQGPDGDAYLIVDRVRSKALWILGLAFVMMVVVAGRVIGATSILGLAASLLVIMRFVIPGMLSGHDPRMIAMVGASVIMLTTLYMAHGINLKTTVALVGTAIALVFTVALSAFAISLAQLTGIASEDTATLQVLAAQHVDATGVLLGGIVIGALGVLNDITVAQASAVFELRQANASFTVFELYRRAMNVGRDHISATVNTLVLAYAGASLPLLMLLALQGEPLATELSREFIATEVVRSLVGSMGLIAAVPLTTVCAVLVAARVRSDSLVEADGSHSHHH
ncbi:MAG: YibE/F family protein [Chloroflexi bacterium]|nr:MAG: YibE/F family protein [Chloroflexota bacterium]